MPLPILLFGRNGQVGWELIRTLAPLGKVTAVGRPDIDLADPEPIRHLIRDLKPSLIVNAAAYTAVDKAESEPELALAVNGLAPGVIAEEAQRAGALLVHYSTDYVFDGTKAGPYVETDPTDPVSAYGRSKLEGERSVQAVGGRHLIFRLCWVYGARGNNFMRTMLRLGTTREQLRVVNDQHGCPTWCRTIAQATALAVARVLPLSDPARFDGVYHLASSGSTTWHEFASVIVSRIPAALRRSRVVTPIPTSEYPLPARRPANSVLDCSRLEQTFGLRLPGWETALKWMFEEPLTEFACLAS